MQPASPPDLQRYTSADDIEQVWSEQLMMDIDLADRHHCSFKMQRCKLPGLGLSLFAGNSAVMARSREQAVRAPQDLILCIASTSNVRVNRDGAETTYLPGQAHVWSADQSTVCEVDGDYSAIMLNIPTSLLPNVDIDRIFDRGIVNTTAQLELLVCYARDVARLWGDLNDVAAGQVAAHLNDLMTLVLSQNKIDCTEIRQRHSVRTARLARVKTDIQNHLAHPDLSPGWIAAREGISKRYLRDLLTDEDTNFSQLVLKLRLNRAYQQLSDSRARQFFVSDIAFGCGFGDLSYFCRVFKRHFGATPTEVRQHNHKG